MALARHKHHSVLQKSKWQESKGFTSGGVWLEGFELRDDCKTMLQMTLPLYRYRLECVQHETCKYKLDAYLHPCTVFKITPSMDIQFVIAACWEDFIARMTSRLQEKKQIWDDSDLDYHLEGHILLSPTLSLSLLIFLSPSLSQSLSFFSSLSLTYLFSCNLSLSLFFFSPSLSLSLSLFLPHKHANILVSCDKLETGYNNSAITLESGN